MLKFKDFFTATKDAFLNVEIPSEWGRVTSNSPWYEPFFTRATAPKFFERSNIDIQSAPISVLKNKPLYETLQRIIQVLPQGAYIAGGFMRAVAAGEKEVKGDIDIFFNNAKAFNDMIELLRKYASDDHQVLGGYKPDIPLEEFRATSKKHRYINFTSENKDGRPPFQLIKLVWFDSPEHVIDSFDLTIVQLATDGTNLYFGPETIADLKSHTLRLHRSQVAIMTLNRLLKYEKKGYNADPEKFKDIADDAAKMILNAKKDEIEQYFYLPKAAPGYESDRAVPVKWLNHAWKYLVESENGRLIFAKIFGSKERVEEDLKKIEKTLLDKAPEKIYY